MDLLPHSRASRHGIVGLIVKPDGSIPDGSIIDNFIRDATANREVVPLSGGGTS